MGWQGKEFYLHFILFPWLEFITLGKLLLYLKAKILNFLLEQEI